MKRYNMNPVFILPIPGLMGTTGLLQGHPQRASSVTHKNVSTTYVPRRALVGCAQPMHINIFQTYLSHFRAVGRRERERKGTGMGRGKGIEKGIYKEV